MSVPRSKNARLYYRCAGRRRVEAKILIEANQPTGAVYLAGYVVECMLKSLILETTPLASRGDHLADLKKIGHSIAKLLVRYERDGNRRPPTRISHAFALTGDWSSDIRYDPSEIELDDARAFLKAVDEIYLWVDGRL